MLEECKTLRIFINSFQYILEIGQKQLSRVATAFGVPLDCCPSFRYRIGMKFKFAVGHSTRHEESQEPGHPGLEPSPR